MSIRERVFKKIAEVEKVELATQKVELATQKQLYSALDKLVSGQRDVDKGRAKLEKSYPIGLKLIAEIKNQAKELGVNPDDIKGYKVLNMELKNTKSLYI